MEQQTAQSDNSRDRLYAGQDYSGKLIIFFIKSISKKECRLNYIPQTEDKPVWDLTQAGLSLF